MSTCFTINLKIRLLSIQRYKLYHYWITKSVWKLYLLSVICYMGGTAVLTEEAWCSWLKKLRVEIEADEGWGCCEGVEGGWEEGLENFMTNFYVLRQIF